MSSEQRDFARRVLDAFAVAGRHTDQEVAAARGPSSTTMTTLRKVAEGKAELASLRAPTYRAIDLAANWKEGSARALLADGTEPTPASPRRMVIHSDPEWLNAAIRQLANRVLETEERLDLLESQLRKEGGGDGTQASTQKSELERRRQRRGAEASDADASLDPAALDAEPDVDEEPGGSDHDEG